MQHATMSSVRMNRKGLIGRLECLKKAKKPYTCTPHTSDLARWTQPVDEHTPTDTYICTQPTYAPIHLSIHPPLHLHERHPAVHAVGNGGQGGGNHGTQPRGATYAVHKPCRLSQAGRQAGRQTGQNPLGWSRHSGECVCRHECDGFVCSHRHTDVRTTHKHWLTCARKEL